MVLLYCEMNSDEERAVAATFIASPPHTGHVTIGTHNIHQEKGISI